MLLNTEELLALVDGDAEPERLANLLDRLEQCPDSAEALQLLVTLRANREEALEALREAAEYDLPAPIPHPAARRVPSSPHWGLRALRIAASLALVTVLGVWAASVYVDTFGTVDTAGLATTAVVLRVRPVEPDDIEFTNTGDSVLGAYDLLRSGEFEDAVRLLEAEPRDELGFVPLGLGIGHYFLQQYPAALEQFELIRESESFSPDLRSQAAWYEANALLALDQPVNSMALLEVIKTDASSPFQEAAQEKYEELREAIGLTPSAHR